MWLSPIYCALRRRRGSGGYSAHRPTNGCPTTYPGPGHTEMPKEQVVESRPSCELPIKFLHLIDKGFLHAVFLPCTDPIRLPRIREGCDRNVAQLNQLRLGR